MAREILVTEPKLVFLAGQYLALANHAGQATGRSRAAKPSELDASAAKVRDALYQELRPLLRRHGYDEETCLRLDVSAGLDPQGRFAVHVVWERDPKHVLTGDVIPAPNQTVPTPPWHPSYVMYRRHSETSEIPIIVSDPVALLLLNIHDALHSAWADVVRLHGRGNPTAQWRELEQGALRMERRLADTLAEWSPLMPPTLESLLAATPAELLQTAEALRDPRTPRVAAYQLVVNALVDAVAQAVQERSSARGRLGGTARALHAQLKRITLALQVTARRLDPLDGPDVAPLRWKPLATA